MKEQNEKQAIEELTALMDGACDVMPLGECYTVDCNKCKAALLYNAGYRKQSVGEWKWIADDSPMCNICGNVFDTDDNADAGTGLWKFCPNCGARMKGGAE